MHMWFQAWEFSCRSKMPASPFRCEQVRVLLISPHAHSPVRRCRCPAPDAVASAQVVGELGQVAPLPRLRVVAVDGDQFVAVLVASAHEHGDRRGAGGGRSRIRRRGPQSWRS